MISLIDFILNNYIIIVIILMVILTIVCVHYKLEFFFLSLFFLITVFSSYFILKVRPRFSLAKDIINISTTDDEQRNFYYFQNIKERFYIPATKKYALKKIGVTKHIDILEKMDETTINEWLYNIDTFESIKRDKNLSLEEKNKIVEEISKEKYNYYSKREFYYEFQRKKKLIKDGKEWNINFEEFIINKKEIEENFRIRN